MFCLNRGQAKIFHPDKSGDENTARMQEILNAYDKLEIDFKKKGVDIMNSDMEERFFRENFEKFNFPFANNGSFTVTIENDLANTWQECIEEDLGEPRVSINQHGTECDRLWKVMFKAVEITIHLYNNPKNKKGSKLMLQAGKQSVICSYVFDELPRIYVEVCKRKPKNTKQLPNLKKIQKQLLNVIFANLNPH